MSDWSRYHALASEYDLRKESWFHYQRAVSKHYGLTDREPTILQGPARAPLSDDNGGPWCLVKTDRNDAHASVDIEMSLLQQAMFIELERVMNKLPYSDSELSQDAKDYLQFVRTIEKLTVLEVLENKHKQVTD